MAVGAACNELKDAQSLMMPVMLLSMFPVFVWTAVLQNPSSPLSVGMSLFPPASPFLMLMRLALRPAPPAWQVGLSVVLTTATALFCIWAAGKIFRTGLAHARQDAQLPRAGSVGDGPVDRAGDVAVDRYCDPYADTINRADNSRANRASRWKSEPGWMKRTTVTSVSGSINVSNGT